MKIQQLVYYKFKVNIMVKMLKKIGICFLLIISVVFVGCTKEYAANSLKLTSSSINVFDKYDKVVNIVQKYENLFSKEEIIQLKQAQILSTSVYNNIENIIGKEKNFTKILINMTDFFNNYSILSQQFIIVYDIISPKINKMDVVDVNVLKLFDRNARMLNNAVLNLEKQNNSFFGDDVEEIKSEVKAEAIDAMLSDEHKYFFALKKAAENGEMPPTREAFFAEADKKRKEEIDHDEQKSLAGIFSSDNYRVLNYYMMANPVCHL